MDISPEIEAAFILLNISNKRVCQHPYKKHYANGLCSSCYHSPSKNIQKWINWCRNSTKNTRKVRKVECEHVERPHRARGLCAVCYTDWKRRQRINRD